MEYEAWLDPSTGEIACVLRPSCNMSIPLCQDNVDFCRFWLWNSANDYPIELPEDFIGKLDLAKITALGT